MGSRGYWVRKGNFRASGYCVWKGNLGLQARVSNYVELGDIVL